MDRLRTLFLSALAFAPACGDVQPGDDPLATATTADESSSSGSSSGGSSGSSSGGSSGGGPAECISDDLPDGYQLPLAFASVLFTPDGERLVGTLAADDGERIVIASLCGEILSTVHTIDYGIAPHEPFARLVLGRNGDRIYYDHMQGFDSVGYYMVPFPDGGPAIAVRSNFSAFTDYTVDPTDTHLLATNSYGIWILDLVEPYDDELVDVGTLPSRLSLSPDGERIAFSDYHGNLAIADLVTMTHTPVLAGSTALIADIQWLADSRIAFVTPIQNEPSTIWTVDISDGTVGELLTTGMSVIRFEVSRDMRRVLVTSDDSGEFSTYLHEL